MFADYTYTLSVVIDYARVAVDYMRKCLLSGNVMELEGPAANLRLTTGLPQPIFTVLRICGRDIIS